MKHYQIRGLASGLDGLTVQGEDCDRASGYIGLNKLSNEGAIVGDRNVSVLLPDLALLIHKDFLVGIPDPGRREFSSKNPWGKCLFESSYRKGPILIDTAEFERCLQVTVRESMGPTQAGRPDTSKTLFTHYFLPITMGAVRNTIEIHVSTPGIIDDMIFTLRELARTEGQQDG